MNGPTPRKEQMQFMGNTSVVWDGSSDECANLIDYGRLYNWHAVEDSRGLCPNAWHVPIAEEFEICANNTGGLNTAGMAMKSSVDNVPPWDGSNSSGFSSLPGGYRADVGDFSISANGSEACFGAQPREVTAPLIGAFMEATTEFLKTTTPSPMDSLFVASKTPSNKKPTPALVGFLVM